MTPAALFEQLQKLALENDVLVIGDRVNWNAAAEKQASVRIARYYRTQLNVLKFKLLYKTLQK